VGTNTDLFSVALHETGMRWDWDTRSNPGAVMYPYYRMQTGLTRDDIAGIQALYGPAVTTPAVPTVPIRRQHRANKCTGRPKTTRWGGQHQCYLVVAGPSVTNADADAKRLPPSHRPGYHQPAIREVFFHGVDDGATSHFHCGQRHGP